MKKKRIAVIIGTRPEAIKMASIIKALEKSNQLSPLIIATAQHREMLDQALDIFSIKPDFDLDIMRPNQGLPELTTRLIAGISQVLRECEPDALLVQGDTTSVLAASLVAFYHQIPVGHVEAGLRTHDLRNPFPEEMNRVVTARLARWHFAPTESSRINLLNEGYAPDTVFVTGNTVIDALFEARQHPDKVPFDKPDTHKRMMVTTHRRENFGEPLERICAALLRLLDRHPELDILFPVHRNPSISGPVKARLGRHPRVTLCEPLDYLAFISAMESSDLILSDSGGVQEEAPALGKPVLVLRDETERPEALTFGVAALVGTDTDTIVERVTSLLDDEASYRRMARGASPYGDGHAATRIVGILENAFKAPDPSTKVSGKAR